LPSAYWEIPTTTAYILFDFAGDELLFTWAKSPVLKTERIRTQQIDLM